MKFRTELTLPVIKKGTITHESKIIMLGSCFSDNIGKRFSDSMFDIVINPFGTIFNPASISRGIEILLNAKQFCADDLFMHNGVWNSFYFYSRYSGVNQQSVLDGINRSITIGSEQIKGADIIFVTLGTAYIYLYNGEVVSNCHKLPNNQFERRMLTVSEIVETLSTMVRSIHTVNSKAKIIFTVSPIRHIADGLADNSLSKSTLRVAIAELNALHPELCSYFPAYEIVNDDLRDYRFYASDMIHPNDMAIDYIWEKLTEYYIDNNSIESMKRCSKLLKRINHKPMTDNEELIAKFFDETAIEIEKIKQQLPYMATRINEIWKQKN
ncbi:MAG: GSCFA domain-containing protein [Bacteroidales bacterium]